jgi:hypothetical protein
MLKQWPLWVPLFGPGIGARTTADGKDSRPGRAALGVLRGSTLKQHRPALRLHEAPERPSNCVGARDEHSSALPLFKDALGDAFGVVLGCSRRREDAFGFQPEQFEDIVTVSSKESAQIRDFFRPNVDSRVVDS